MAGMMIPMDLHFFWVETSNQPGTLKLKPSPKHVVHDEGSWATLCTETSFCDPLDCVNQKIMMVETIKHGLQTQDFCQIIQVAADATTVLRDGSPDQPEKWWKKMPGGAVHESSALLVYIVYGCTCNTLVRRRSAVSQNCNDFCRWMEEYMSFCEKTCASIVSWCLLENCAVLAPICTVSVLVDFLQALRLGKVYEGSFSRRLTSKPCFVQNSRKNATGGWHRYSIMLHR